MTGDYSTEELLGFLDHAAERGLMPAATATALQVASRTVFAVLSDQERGDVRTIDLDTAIRRFENTRADDLTPKSLTAYGSRVRRAVALFIEWRGDPANFRPTTRSSAAVRQSRHGHEVEMSGEERSAVARVPPSAPGSYQTAYPLRSGNVVTVLNLPEDLTVGEANKLSDFIMMLARGSGAASK